MLTVTPSAWERLTQILTTRPTVTAIRLTIADGEFKCCPGDRRDRDRVIQLDKNPTLLMSPRISKTLKGRTLDVTETERGPRLRLRPEATSTES